MLTGALSALLRPLGLQVTELLGAEDDVLVSYITNILEGEEPFPSGYKVRSVLSPGAGCWVLGAGCWVVLGGSDGGHLRVTVLTVTPLPWTAVTDIDTSMPPPCPLTCLHHATTVEQSPEPRRMQMNITGFLHAKNARLFMKELWELLVSAQG